MVSKSLIPTHVFGITDSPLKPVCRFNNSLGAQIQNNEIDVVKGTEVTIFCETSAMPFPNFTWSVNANYQTLTPQTIKILSAENDTSITVTATNVMHPTGGDKQLPTSNWTTVTIYVLSIYLITY